MRLAFTFLTALAVLALAGCGRSLVTAENAARLKPGMPEAEISAILGDRDVDKSARTPRGGRPQATYTYRTERLWVKVECEDGKIAEVLTHDPARKVVVPARNAMPVLDLSYEGPAAAAMDEAIARGGAEALAEWMQRELVPGRPAIGSSKRESVIVDRGIFRRDEGYRRPLLAPLTDEHRWAIVSSAELTVARGEIYGVVFTARPPVK